MVDGTVAVKKPSKARKVAVIVIVAVVVIFFIASYVVDGKLLDTIYERQGPRETAPVMATYEETYAATHQRTPVEFELNGQTLRGYIYTPKGDSRGFIVFRHGIFASHSDYIALLLAVVDKGWTVFAYDAIGCGESDGDNVISMAQSGIDVHAALEFVRETDLAGDQPVMLWGHSWGGYGVAAALGYDDEATRQVVGCCSMSGFDSPVGILVETSANALGPLAYTQVPTLWLNMVADAGFGPANQTATDAINKTKASVMIIHGGNDEVISYEGASIMAQMMHITNRWTTLLSVADPERSGHSNYFYSPESYELFKQGMADYEELAAGYDGDVPADVLAAFRAEHDIAAMNIADPWLVDEIDGFFQMAIDRVKDAA